MNFEAGIRFIIFLVLFGFINYRIMLRRYKNDIKKSKFLQQKKFPSYIQKGHLFSKN